MYYYINEKTVYSEIRLVNIPVLTDVANEPSIFIRTSSTPSSHIPDRENGVYYSPKTACHGSQVGTIEINEGCEMLVHIYDGSEEADIVPYIIGWGFSFLFSQQGFTVLHGAALNIDGQGAIVSGVSGSGKSTISLELLKRGATYLSDDMVPLKPAEGIFLRPLYPIQKVCRDVSISLDPEALCKINEGRDKYSYINKDDYCNHQVDLKYIFILNSDDIESVKVKEYTGLDKYLQVLSCMFQAELYATFGTPETDKYNCLKIASAARVIGITRPKSGDTKEEITDTIMNACIRSVC